MRLLYTEQALEGLEEVLEFIGKKVNDDRIFSFRDQILNRADTLIKQPFIGQKEPMLENLGLGHRRLIVGHCKIIYKIIDEYIYITDIFDSRQDPDKMKG